MRYSTKQDAIQHLIYDALGDFSNDYDTDAIADEILVYRVDTDDQGNELLNTAGFEQGVSDEEFWAIAERHDLSA